MEQGSSLAISTPILKVQGEKAGAGTCRTALGALVVNFEAVLGGLISRGARGAGISAAARAGVAILTSLMQPKGSNSDVDLASGSIFETKLDRPITISNPKLLASNVPEHAQRHPRHPAQTPQQGCPAVEVSTPDRRASTDARPEESVSNTVPTLEPLSAEASTSSANSSVCGTHCGNTERRDYSEYPSSRCEPRAGGCRCARSRRQPMNNLRQDDFRIFEDGVEQRIRFFSRDSLPLAVALVIDRKGSVRR